jgi:dTDP-4-dehydrorhamnose reductase
MIEKNKVLILGSLGMLGQELVRVFSSDEQYVVTGWDRDDIDVTDFEVFEKKLTELAPNLVLNAVAYNAVDKCEIDDEEYQKALLLNRDVPKKLAELGVKLGYVLVHYSTDYVFDGALETNKAKTGCCGGGCCGAGSQEVGYNEESLPNPLSRYGESKYFGERAVQAQGGKYYLIRLSKLFGNPAKSAAGKRSFFAVMLEQTEQKLEVEVVDDEKSCFTYAPDLAQATKGLIESESEWGIYHLPNDGGATWYEATMELYRLAEKETRVVPVASAAFPRPARRPSSATLLNTKRPKQRHYTEALQEFLR